ncbi:MAG: sugar phosphate isomerase/epimerase family protein [Phycisphaerales bacterium]|jgi:sugar phosphate isomerase/epimerase|nr:sugar phosphate isomerase/epimerase family protein [Phycisphaerales bacterium]
MKLAFSTIACPEWTLSRVAEAAEGLDYSGVELRTFGTGSTSVASDPALTDPAKVLDVMASRGIAIASLASSVRFDEPIFPPVIGRIFGDNEKSVRACKSIVDLAAQVECPSVRVFGFALQGGESRAALVRRVVERLTLAAATARHKNVRILLESGGAFTRVSELCEVIDRVGSDRLGVAYSVALAHFAGEDASAGLDVLLDRYGDDRVCVKLRDYHAGDQTPLGAGDVPVEAIVRRLADRRFAGWSVVEWDRLWEAPEIDAEAALRDAAEHIARWSARARIAPGRLAAV